MRFRCSDFNADRTFLAEDFGAAAARVADYLARQSGGRRACAWTLREESTSTDRSRRFYSSTSAIPMKTPGEARVVWTHWFTVRLAGSAA